VKNNKCGLGADRKKKIPEVQKDPPKSKVYYHNLIEWFTIYHVKISCCLWLFIMIWSMEDKVVQFCKTD
jgi:hypothetical protein